MVITSSLTLAASAAEPARAAPRFTAPSSAAWTTVRVAAPRDLRRCVLMGACMAGYQAAYFTAVTLSGITMTALIAICSAPLMIAALAPAALGERLTPRVRFALGLGVAGTALLVAAPQGMLG